MIDFDFIAFIRSTLNVIIHLEMKFHRKNDQHTEIIVDELDAQFPSNSVDI